MFYKAFSGLNKRNGGFTLIELLVVISIIGLLSSVIMVSVEDARTKSKVAKVKADFIQIRNAAELYKTNTGSYPVPNTGPPSNYVTVLVPDYLPTTPTSPFGGNYVVGTEINNSSWCGSTFNQSTDMETGKLFVFLSNGVNVPAKYFNKFQAYNTYNFYDGINALQVNPCFE